MTLIYLASQSPRRLKILQEANFIVEVISVDVAEIYPSSLSVYEVASYLAELKMDAALKQYPNLKNQTIITADTVVIYNNTILGKPKDLEEARQMLMTLNGQQHEVMTGVAIYHNNKVNVLKDITKVYLNNYLTMKLMPHYANYSFRQSKEVIT
ncbi:MAG: Maf family protein [Chitinophagales bacterium]